MNDLRFAFRQLLKNPGFTAVACLCGALACARRASRRRQAVLTLALGIGANTAIFAVLNAIMFRPLPYPKPDRLVRLHRTSPQSERWPLSVANFLDLRDQNTVFEKTAAFVGMRFTLAEPGEPAESLRGIAAAADLFPALGVQAALGRVFGAEEDQPGRNRVIVLNHGYWLRRFAGDTNILGRTLRIDGESVVVLGVMPASFDFSPLWGPIDAWRPLAFTPEQRRDRQDNWLNALARLKHGVSLAQAKAAARLLADRLAKAHPETNAENSLRLSPLSESIGDAASRRFAWLLLGLTGFILLIACVNLANLQLARATARSREWAVRLALGAGQGRLMLQLLGESLVVALIGGVAVALRKAVAELDPNLPVNDPESARSRVDRQISHFQLAGIFLGAFSVLGLVLAALGIYGVVSYFVVKRTSEIGLRLALGAHGRDVIWLMLGRGLLFSSLGALLGLGGAVVVARVIGAAVPELPAPSPYTIAGVILALLAVTVLACWLPARRAARIDPMEALRQE